LPDICPVSLAREGFAPLRVRDFAPGFDTTERERVVFMIPT